jgi:hypothetical protein
MTDPGMADHFSNADLSQDSPKIVILSVTSGDGREFGDLDARTARQFWDCFQRDLGPNVFPPVPIRAQAA